MRHGAIVWANPKRSPAAGGAVKAGDVLVIIESMKMEIAISAPADGTLIEIRCAEGQAVSLGQALAVFIPTAA